MKKNVLSVRVSLKGLAAAAAFLLAGVAQAAVVPRFIIDDGSTIAYEHPEVAVDSSGNVHIVAQGIPVADLAGNTRANEEIYYTRISRNGSVLTPPTVISVADTSSESRPHIALTPGGQAVVAWGSSSVVAVLVNPDGSVAVPETAIAGTNYGHFSIAVDGNNEVHLIGDNGTNVMHTRFAASTLAVDVAQHSLGATTYNREQNTSVAVDGAGNLQVLFCSGTNANPAYMELDNSGNVLIGETPLYTANGTAPPGQFVYISTEGGAVHAIYSDKRDTLDFPTPRSYEGQGGSVFYSRINPAAHSLGAGNPGDINQLRVGSEVRLMNAWYAYGFRGTDGVVRAMAGSGTKGTGDINYAALRSNTISSGHVQAQISAYNYYRKWAVGAGNMVVWAESVYSPTLAGGTMRLVASTVAAFDAIAKDETQAVTDTNGQGLFGCAMGSGRGPVDPTLWVLAALSAFYIARRRAHATH